MSDLGRLADDYNAMRRERDDALCERDRLQRIFDDAGEGQYNVLALIEAYQTQVAEAESAHALEKAAHALEKAAHERTWSRMATRTDILDHLRKAVRGVIADAQEHVDDGEDCGRLGSGRRGACRLCRAADELRRALGGEP